MYKEIKSQAVQYGQMKVQLTTFKAVVNQRLNEHEKTQEFINSRFEDIELQNDHLNRDMDAMRESVEDKEEVIQQLLSRVDELEQYSRRECLVLNGVKENPHETEDVQSVSWILAEFYFNRGLQRLYTGTCIILQKTINRFLCLLIVFLKSKTYQLFLKDVIKLNRNLR